MMDKAYNPKDVEPQITELWDRKGIFHADPAAGANTYSIVIPPPNVTAVLHLGHALNNALQDVLVRWKRMCGCSTLWMPGTDHAGIATQTVVEKRILAEEGKRRTDFARDEFVARVQSWKDEYEGRILGQLKAMGCSCDWDRTRFTMDEVCAKAVRAAFFKLFADGLIYRGKRLVNWDPATQTVLADDEVEHETVQGHFWYLQYKLVESVRIAGETVDHVTVATTRPETMLGDTAVAMNPADPRAKELVGRKVRLPIVGREIPIIADEHVVLPDPDSEDAKASFSTGFLKVTPAHDPDDWAIGQRHNLPVINVMAPDGSISDKHGWDDCTTPEAQNLVGMDRFEAREAVVEFFRQEGLLEDVRDYAHEVGHSYRSHVPIEPYLSDQWFIAVRQAIPDSGIRIPKTANVETRDGVAYIAGTDVPANSLAGLALLPLLNGELRFVPDRYAANYRTWLENLRDWPISRQLWWGHRIPVWSFRFTHAASGLPSLSELREEQLQKFERFLDVCGMRDEVSFQWAKELVDGTLPLHCCSRSSRGDQLLDDLCAMARRRQQGRRLPQDQQLRDMLRDFDAKDREFEATYGEEALTTGRNLCLEIVVRRPGVPGSYDLQVRDPDVLDTWFSSALWPISTMGWPEETDLLKAFYPTNVLCTAREIITLWVSRMVMFGQYFRGQIPFPDVYIHAMIQDGQGRKMSKSLGNGIDPLDIISSHGADAMRFTLCYMTTETQDVRMPVEAMVLPDGRKANTSPKFDIGRNFCNKLWNAARFAMMNLEAAPAWGEIHPAAEASDAWILSRLNATIRDVTAALEGYRYHEAAAALYRYMWNDFCDWYLEMAKVRIAAGDAAPKAVLAHALDGLLRLLHPMLPFVTEYIWSQLNAVVPNRGPESIPAEAILARAAWPRAQAEWVNPALEERFALLQQLIGGIREVRSRHNVPATRKVRVTIAASGDAARMVTDSAAIVQRLADVESLSADPAAEPGGSDATVLAGGLKAFVHDVIDREAELKRLTGQTEMLTKGIRGIEGKLSNASFVAKAPPEVVQRERERLVGLKAELEAVQKSLEALS